MASNPETTRKHYGAPLWKPGQSGNPAGRPKGSRQKLSEDFLNDMQSAWSEHGKAAIEAMIADKPGEFVKTVASLLPREMTLNLNDDRAELTDDELIDRIRTLTEGIAPLLAGRVGSENERPGAPEGPLQLN